jgi:hypothetical protein
VKDEGIHAPDWERYKVTAKGVNAPVGDPIRWGVQIFTPVPAVTNVTAAAISVSTRDGYSRSWSMLGTLTLPNSVWSSATSYVALDCTMGVGQVQLTQSIVLLLGAGGPTGGLCRQQNVSNGGPYFAVAEPHPGVAGLDDTYPFAIIGGLVGQSLSVRVNYALPVATPDLPTISRLTLVVAPYAAGEGL